MVIDLLDIIHYALLCEFRRFPGENPFVPFGTPFFPCVTMFFCSFLWYLDAPGSQLQYCHSITLWIPSFSLFFRRFSTPRKPKKDMSPKKSGHVTPVGVGLFAGRKIWVNFEIPGHMGYQKTRKNERNPMVLFIFFQRVREKNFSWKNSFFWTFLRFKNRWSVLSQNPYFLECSGLCWTLLL